MSSCLSNQLIVNQETDFNNLSSETDISYITVGLKNGNCHYKKFKKDDFEADCYAPISVMRDYASIWTKYANKMCDNSKYSNTDNAILVKKFKNLQLYCK